MNTVFLIHHVARDGQPDEDTKLLGVYSDRQQAHAALTRFLKLPGFRDDQAGFLLEEYTLNEDHWTEGFVTVE